MIDKLTGTAGSTIENKDTISVINSARIPCDQVYNLYYGQVVNISAADGRAVVNVKCNPSEILRYGNLKELTCAKSYFADPGAQLGVADEYVVFEYCTLWQGQSVYPVRVNNITYYKQDPTDVLNGTYTIRRDGAQEQGYTRNRDRVRFTTDKQRELFGENVLDKMDEARSKQVQSTKKSRAFLQKLASTTRVIGPRVTYTTEDDDDIED